jgi:hypothetical protein
MPVKAARGKVAKARVEKVKALKAMGTTARVMGIRAKARATTGKEG